MHVKPKALSLLITLKFMGWSSSLECYALLCWWDPPHHHVAMGRRWWMDIAHYNNKHWRSFFFSFLVDFSSILSITNHLRLWLTKEMIGIQHSHHWVLYFKVLCDQSSHSWWLNLIPYLPKPPKGLFQVHFTQSCCGISVDKFWG